MNAAAILDQLKSLGTQSYKGVLLKHGIPEPVFGVKIEELKKFHQKIKVDYQLALDLYDTGIYDAMYLAGLIADDGRMTKKAMPASSATSWAGDSRSYCPAAART